MLLLRMAVGNKRKEKKDMRNGQSVCGRQGQLLAFLAAMLNFTGLVGTAAETPVTALRDRLEPVWDTEHIAGMSGVSLTLHPPKIRETAIVHDAPWEGSLSCYHTVFQDGPLYRMYYRGSAWDRDKEEIAHEAVCYAESDDGIVWRKPNLGLFEFAGSTSNNIIWQGFGSHNFAAFRDDNPACPPEQRYKAVGNNGGVSGLVAFVSPDAVHWEKLRPEPVITGGDFDSQNVAFWDAENQRYVAYFRKSLKDIPSFKHGVRAIKVCTSKDFITWSESEWLSYGEGTPVEELYTNAILPYPRAPHMYVGFPKRFIFTRTTRNTVGGFPGLSDGVFMSSRDGRCFHRWTEAFLRPGLQPLRWSHRNNMIAWGMVETAPELPGAPRELSLYSTEGYFADEISLRRMTMRLDGFVSARATLAGGTLTTTPLTFTPTADPYTPPEESGGAPVLTNGLFGAAALRVSKPLAMPLPGTSNLGSRVTLAVAYSGMPAGVRRLFSAYAGGQNTVGGRKLLVDLAAGGTFPDGTALRAWYDGMAVAMSPDAMPDWKEASVGGRMHVTVTYDDGIIAIYVNGVERARGGKAGAGPLAPALGDIRFGEDYPPIPITDEPFIGLADDITVIGRVLSAAEIAAAAASGMAKVVQGASDRGVFLDMEGDAGLSLLSNKLANGVPEARLPGGTSWGDTMLLVNLSTSAAGSLRCEIRDSTGKAIPGFSLEDCPPLYGDGIEMPVCWKNGADVSALAGRAIALHIELKDADLFAYRFGQPARSPSAPKQTKQFALSISKQRGGCKDAACR